jgi:hypothetical protein
MYRAHGARPASTRVITSEGPRETDEGVAGVGEGGQ